MRMETIIHKLNERGYTINMSQSDGLRWDIELCIIRANDVKKVNELLDYTDLASGLEMLLKWLDEPSMPKPIYKSKEISNEEFDTALFDYVREEYDDNPANILTIPGVYEVVAEYLNNEVLDYIQEKREESK